MIQNPSYSFTWWNPLTSSRSDMTQITLVVFEPKTCRDLPRYSVSLRAFHNIPFLNMHHDSHLHILYFRWSHWFLFCRAAGAFRKWVADVADRCLGSLSLSRRENVILCSTLKNSIPLLRFVDRSSIRYALEPPWELKFKKYGVRGPASEVDHRGPVMMSRTRNETPPTLR